MKKITLILSAAFAILLSSCQKENVFIEKTTDISFKENGYQWAGFDINDPFTKFDIAMERIGIEDSGYTDVAQKLGGKSLPNSGKKRVYLVKAFVNGNFYTAQADLARRGWKLAPLSYLLALGREYGSTWNNAYWNTFCLDVPALLSFNGATQEKAAVCLSGSLYDQSTNSNYSVSLRFARFTDGSQDAYFICYR
jgi:hypothetical protein